MAKRKRLTLPPETGAAPAPAPAPETKGMFAQAPLGKIPQGRRGGAAGKSAPIADMAGAAAATAALEEVSAELASARAEGRLVQKLRTSQIDVGHLMRDRVMIDSADMAALMASIRARGQQAPIEVLETKRGTFGLISGWRRLSALGRLYEETGDPQFAFVNALVRQPASAQQAYVAMVEENEIRVGLSYYERAQIVARTVQAGVYPDSKKALQTLFASASRAKRSKIKSFLPIVQELGGALHHPAAIGERMGLELSQRLAAPAFVRAAQKALDEDAPRSVEEEQEMLAGVLKDSTRAEAPTPKTPKSEPEELGQGIRLRRQRSGIVLEGPGVTENMIDRLRDFLKEG